MHTRSKPVFFRAVFEYLYLIDTKDFSELSPDSDSNKRTASMESAFLTPQVIFMLKIWK